MRYSSNLKKPLIITKKWIIIILTTKHNALCQATLNTIQFLLQ